MFSLVYTQEVQKTQLLARLKLWFKVGERHALWTKVCRDHGINFLVAAVFMLDQSIVAVAAETLVAPLFQLGFKLSECRAMRVLGRKPTVLDSFECLKPASRETLLEFCRNFRIHRLPALLHLHSRLQGMAQAYLFQAPFVSDDSLVDWLMSQQSCRCYAAFRTSLHHAKVHTQQSTRAVNVLDALLIIDLALWWGGEEGMEDFS